MICPPYIRETPREVKREILNPYFQFFFSLTKEESAEGKEKDIGTENIRTCVTRR
jgi:hypothetical protein